MFSLFMEVTTDCWIYSRNFVENHPYTCVESAKFLSLSKKVHETRSLYFGTYWFGSLHNFQEFVKYVYIKGCYGQTSQFIISYIKYFDWKRNVDVLFIDNNLRRCIVDKPRYYFFFNNKGHLCRLFHYNVSALNVLLVIWLVNGWRIMYELLNS